MRHPDLTLVCALALLAAALSMAALTGDAAGAENPGDVEFKNVSVGPYPDALPAGDTLEIEMTIDTSSEIKKVQIFYCNDDQCLLPKDMTDDGDGVYSFSIYAEGNTPTDDDSFYDDGIDQVWVKLMVETSEGKSYYPTEDIDGYDEGYLKVDLDYGDGTTDGEDGGDGTTDGEDGGDGTLDGEDGYVPGDDEDDDDDESTPGFEALAVMAAFAAITCAALFGRRKRN